MSSVLESDLTSGDVWSFHRNKYLKDAGSWSNFEFIAFAFLVVVLTESLARAIPVICSKANRIPLNPKLHLDRLSTKDLLFIWINKLLTVCFAYHFFCILWKTSSVKWELTDATFANTVLVLIPFFITYDFFYSAWHKFLHLRSVYGYIHKHHHRQISPTRGHYDAFNVHPVEFVVGEYTHALVVWLIPCHVLAPLLFLLLGVVLATLNHTRLACAVPGMYDSKNHAVHHRLPETNFGQYTMFWDKMFGWFVSYDESLATKGA